MGRKTRIILFDDDQNIREGLKQVFKHRGYEVLIYEDPSLCSLQHSHDCQCQKNERCADIVITDIDMPTVSGIDFVDEQVSKGCKIQNIAIMSGAWSEENIKRAKALGCAVFDKPFDLSVLMDWIKECEGRMGQIPDLCNWFLQKNDELSSSCQ